MQKSRRLALSSDVRKYQTTDGDIAKGGVYYYRIQQWDKDGRNALSRTVAVRIEVKDNKVALYPNPARDYSTLSVELKGNEDAVVYVFNVEGQLVQTYNLESENKYGLNKKIRISGLSTGVYMVQTTQGSYTDIKKLIITE
ncbi:MAG: T9SS type A sorting domain-containing protein [Saprospiraceae bacterium]|nr:T9SS type A sorting domain-containing protein [Saprospiraceae bacterium]